MDVMTHAGYWLAIIALAVMAIASSVTAAVEAKKRRQAEDALEEERSQMCRTRLREGELYEERIRKTKRLAAEQNAAVMVRAESLARELKATQLIKEDLWAKLHGKDEEVKG